MMIKAILFFFTINVVLATDLSKLPTPYCELKTLYPMDNFGWFGPHKEAVIKQLILENSSCVVVELGSFLGKSTRFIAKCLPPEGKVYAIDHWLGNIEHQNSNRTDVYSKLSTLYERFLSNVIHENLCHKIIPIRATTLEAISIIPERPDFVFVDAGHDFDSVFSDLEAWYPMIKNGGVLCGDDWLWGENKPVQRAVRYFADKHMFQILTNGTIWWIYKRKPSS